MTEAEHS